MRFRLLLAGALAAGLAAAAPAGAHASTNPQQAGLQVALRAQGLYRGPIDAIAGPLTAAAVRAFQRSHGLPVTGVADARTRAALGPMGRPLFGARTLRRGAFGWDVAVLQYLLVARGIKVPVNAYFDGPTLRGVRAYQRRLHLAPDGVVGPHTLAAVEGTTRVPVKAKTVVVARRWVVKPGESLSAIAQRFRTTVSALAHLNRLDPGKPLLIGTRLRLPAVVHVQPAAARVSSVAAVRASIDRWAAHFGVDPHLARALAWMESGYNNRLVSSVGAQGIMQLLPTTWTYVETVLLGHKVAHTADGNVEVGVAYLHHLLGAFNGDRRLALAGWYQGERAVRERGVLKVSETFVADVLALAQRM
ncbi:MAG TPA: peptidoglycan-binding protein [Gaiellaceae bacterium]|nr:peptidoglycan-binding protein [Gaiellaceae bacterium]